MRVILITGANGFIGKNLIEYLNHIYPEFKIKTISRVSNDPSVPSYDDFMREDYSVEYFDDVTDVVHLAAVAHKFDDLNYEEINKVNVEYPTKLIKLLKLKSLEKFIFMSSIGVSLFEQGIFLDTKVYAESKRLTEKKLSDEIENTNIKIVCIRAPIVYGKDAPGNFKKIIKLLNFPIILPFGAMDFEKPMIHIKNLVSAIASVIIVDSERCRGGVYEISDPFEIKFNDFLKKLNISVCGRAIIIPFPLKILNLLMLIVGKKNLYRKLVLSFKVSNNKFDQDFNWPKLVDKDTMFDDISIKHL